MNNQCDIILTYCWNRVGYTILRSLTEKGLKVWAADTSKRNICTMSKYCAGSFVYPDPFTEEEAFIKVLKGKVAELKPRVLMPTHDESVVIMRHREEFPEDLITPIRDEEAARILGEQDENASSAAVTEVNYEIGDKVKITDGPFSGFSGTVDEIIEDRSKLKVIVVIFGRKTLLELSFTQVTKE